MTIKTTRERMRDWLGSREAYAAGADETDAMCRELDDLRGQVAKALGQIGMLGLPDVDADAHGGHRHRKVFSNTPQPSTLPRSRKWICAECLEENSDTDALPEGPTYEELVAKKRERNRG